MSICLKYNSNLFKYKEIKNYKREFPTVYREKFPSFIELNYGQFFVLVLFTN